MADAGTSTTAGTATAFKAIFTRRSVRRYDPAPLSDADIAVVQAMLDNVTQIPGQAARFEIVGADRLKGAPSPHAILAYSSKDDSELANIGYSLQLLDLQLQARGYGSLWMGTASPVNPAADYRIMLAFGNTDSPPRNGEGDFKRKKILDISNQDNPVARAARLAPSAVNFQPWKLEFAPSATPSIAPGAAPGANPGITHNAAPNRLTVSFVSGTIARLLTSKFQQIDVGICLRHAVTALEQEGKAITAIVPKGSGKDFAVAVEYSG
jgi:hypothetical protein